MLKADGPPCLPSPSELHASVGERRTPLPNQAAPLGAAPASGLGAGTGAPTSGEKRVLVSSFFTCGMRGNRLYLPRRGIP